MLFCKPLPTNLPTKGGPCHPHGYDPRNFVRLCSLLSLCMSVIMRDVGLEMPKCLRSFTLSRWRTSTAARTELHTPTHASPCVCLCRDVEEHTKDTSMLQKCLYLRTEQSMTCTRRLARTVINTGLILRKENGSGSTPMII